ncbi:hypothetical protein [Streptomyces luteireticuli]|uniref:hypothetical protein n=1 Tax=Streptomyces luteireticuli TaxID=173858 RepID=UPI0035570D24
MNIFKWAARRRVGKAAVVALLANELARGGLQERILACLKERGADPVLRDAVIRELGGFRRKAHLGVRLAEMTGPYEGVGHFFTEIRHAELYGDRILATPSTEPRSRRR